jgi:hypothetical protein
VKNTIKTQLVEAEIAPHDLPRLLQDVNAAKDLAIALIAHAREDFENARALLAADQTRQCIFAGCLEIEKLGLTARRSLPPHLPIVSREQSDGDCAEKCSEGLVTIETAAAETEQCDPECFLGRVFGDVVRPAGPLGRGQHARVVPCEQLGLGVAFSCAKACDEFGRTLVVLGPDRPSGR